MGHGVPNFPKPPARILSPISMPNDLVANKKSYYTEVVFTDFRSAAYGGGNFINITFDRIAAGSTVAGAAVGAAVGSRAGPVGALVGGLVGAFGGSLAASGGTQIAGMSSLRLPIPNKINDIQTLSWEPISITGTVLNGAQNLAGAFGGRGQGLSAAIGAARGVGRIATGLAGKTLNPLLFMAFNNQNFREFTFEWVLAPKNKKESDTILQIVKTFKGAALPSFGFPFQDYPLIAQIKMYPNDLYGHAVFKPLAIEAVGANYTANPNPSFFGDSGAPTIVTLTVRFKEIKLWYRNPMGVPY